MESLSVAIFQFSSVSNDYHHYYQSVRDRFLLTSLHSATFDSPDRLMKQSSFEPLGIPLFSTCASCHQQTRQIMNQDPVTERNRKTDVLKFSDSTVCRSTQKSHLMSVNRHLICIQNLTPLHFMENGHAGWEIDSGVPCMTDTSRLHQC